jgi:ribonuclease P protein subunit RPR2
MGKKPAQKQDGLARMDFLYQASQLYSSSKYQFITTNQLIKVREKLVARLDRSVKRTMCKRCHSILTPLTSKTEYKEFVEITCFSCHSVRRFKMPSPTPNDLTDTQEDKLGTN